MQYRAAIFDIDGTLVHKGEKAPSAALQNAIMRLQAQGVTVIIATGRAHFSARASPLSFCFFTSRRASMSSCVRASRSASGRLGLVQRQRRPLTTK